MQAAPVLYTLDDFDVIVDAGGGWNAFAETNGGPAAAEVVGRPLWNFMAGEETVQLWRHLLARARLRGGMEVDIRCDAPQARRAVRLALTPGRRRLAIAGRIVSEDLRPAIPLFDAEAERSGELLRVCSWCHAVSLDGSWVPVERAAEARGWLTGGRVPGISHSICGACLDSVAGRMV